MSKSQRDKGNRGERKTVQWFVKAGWKAVRTGHAQANRGHSPLCDLPDVSIQDPAGLKHTVEVKFYKKLPRFAKLVETDDMAVLWENNCPPVFVLNENTMKYFLKHIKGTDVK